MFKQTLSSISTSTLPVAPRFGSQIPALPTGIALARSATHSDAWVTKVSERLQEREEAFRLVHDAYCESGLMTDHSSGMRVMKHHLSPHTDVLVSQRNGKVMLTSTLVRDGEFGLPMESLFAPEVAAMRAQGLRVAEISCLSTCSSLSDEKQRFDQLVNLFALTLRVARHHGVDRAIMAVHPRHAKVYQRLLGCSRGSDVRQYASVENKPAVLCVHDFASLDQSGYLLYDKINDPQYTTAQLEGTGMSETERQYFLALSPSIELPRRMITHIAREADHVASGEVPSVSYRH